MIVIIRSDGGSSEGPSVLLRSARVQERPAMASNSGAASIPDERLSIEQRHDGAILVRVKSEGTEGSRLPDAVFSFRCGDPQYSYWLARLKTTPRDC